MIQQSHYCVYVYISKGNKISISKSHLLYHAHCGTIHNSQEMETMYVSIS
jgi:hypothetical protein